MTRGCDHCGLPVGRLGQCREVEGVDHWFCCYGCCLAYQVHHGAPDEPEAASQLIRLGAGGFLAMNIMLFSLLLYADALGDADVWLERVVHWLLLGLSTPLLVVLGGPFLLGAWQAARGGRLSSDVLVSLGAFSAYGYSAVQVILGSTQVYFDTAAMVLVLFTLGRYLEAQGRVRAARSLGPMLAAERADVTVVADGLETRRPVATVQAGEVVRIRPGERIGVDGLVTDGHSECDESILTGQPDPRPKSRGDRVHAGSLNGAGQLWVRATRPGSQTRWIQISRLVREALARKSLVGETLDRVAAWFIPGVLLLAIATMGFWAARGNFSDALLTGFAVLVVACPCSLALAAPLATALGIARAAARGILIRGGGVLERLACVRGIAFDKTGTLTSGVPSVSSLETAGTATPDDVLRRAQPLAQGSDHPLARAIVAFGERAGLVAAPAAEIRAHPGVGVTGLVEGVPCAMGSARLMSALAWPVPRALAAPLPVGTTQVYVGWEGRPRARFVLADEPRPEAQTVVTTLRGQGLETLLLSGDGTRAVAPLAGALGIRTWHAGLSPEAKVKQILHWAESHGPVAMVGDGLNDGPVLASAAVGIAVGDATDLAKESADVIMPTGGLAALPWLVQLARDVRRCVRINLAWAFGYNAVALALAASGYLQPVVAAALMAGSSLLVVARTLRTARTGREREPTRARTEPPPRIADARGLEA